MDRENEHLRRRRRKDSNLLQQKRTRRGQSIINRRGAVVHHQNKIDGVASSSGLNSVVNRGAPAVAEVHPRVVYTPGIN